MPESVMVALITGGLTLFGTVVSNLSMQSKTIYRIDQLEKKVEKHNNLVERVYCCENSINILDERIKDTRGDVGELKREFESGKSSN